MNPPPNGLGKFEAPLVHKVCEFYKKIYLLSSKLPKKERFGIFQKIENICLDMLILSNAAALETRKNKPALLNSCRIKTETLKKLIRVTFELNIIEQKKYFDLELDLEEISKMANGWLKYSKENPR
ncbi:MAG: four helix bundle protein [Candidatus Moranbacteria bacterium]|nr:four helix bundle protein [Candidatus Moranbacteria bacterium]